MARSDRPSGADDRPNEPAVDFVVGRPDEGPDEELPQPDDESRARNRRLRVELGLGALALLVAVLIVRGSLSPSAAPQAQHSTTHSTFSVAPGPTPTGPVSAPPYLYKGVLPPVTSAVADPSHPPFPTRIPLRRGGDPAACPGLRCASSNTVPNSVDDAVQTAFPESTVLRSQTVRLRGGHRVLWFREIDLRAGSEELTLRVQAPAKGDRTRSGHRTADGQTTTFVETSLGPWHVVVEGVDLTGGQVQSDLLSRLAHDPRIVAV